MRLIAFLLLISQVGFSQNQQMLMRTKVAAAPSFSPTDISGLKLWLDGSNVNGDGTNPSDGASVSVWQDLSGNNYDFTTRSGTVTYDATLAGLYFNGSSYMDDFGNMPQETDKFIIIAVLNLPNSGETLQNIFTKGRSYTGSPDNRISPYCIGRRPSTSQIDFIIGDEFANRINVGQPSLHNNNQPFFVYGEYDKVNVNLYVNNILILSEPETDNLYITNTHNHTIGRDPNRNDFYLTGTVLELLFYENQLSAIDRNNLNNYFITKYYGYLEGYVFCDNGITEIVDVTSTTGNVWMDRNLGASRQATSSTDSEAYGDLFQWGRFADGHQCRNSAGTSTNATTAEPNLGNVWDGLWIVETNSPYDWLTPQDDNLWQGVNGVNNPCPTGYRVPTESELQLEVNEFSQDNMTGAFNSALKFTTTGGRNVINTSVYGPSLYALHWSSTIDANTSRRLGIFLSDPSNFTSAQGRGIGYAIRCIKE